MNRYLIECINDCKNEFVVAYAPSMHDDNMSKAADDYAYELAISIVDEEFIVTAEGYKYQGVADFVMARKEVGYIPNTRTPIVEPGNLYDDLSRRDFTVNALAKDPDTGEIIDYFGGLEDIKEKLLRTPLPPIVTFDDDPLRILRAIRFAVTKRFTIEQTTWQAMVLYDYDSKMPVVSEERIREELIKCFRCNTIRTLTYLDYLPRLRDYIFSKTNLWLKPTNEK